MNPFGFLTHPYAVTLARWLLAGILLVAGISKLFEREGFVQAVAAYEILPARASRVLAPVLPWLEIAAGSGLLFGLWTRPSAALAIVLFVIFAVAIVINLARGKDLDCHCFGTLHREKISPTTVLRNVIFMLLATAVLVFADGYLAIDGWLLGTNANTALPITGMIPIALATVAVFVVYLLIQQVWAITRAKES